MCCHPQLLRGIYTVYLESWIGYFGREPLLIVHAESYYTDPLPELRKASSHIGLPEADEKVRDGQVPTPGLELTKAALSPSSDVQNDLS